jgi:glycine/serine hydroxymethyltransferase
MIIGGASAHPRTLDFARFRQIADAVGPSSGGYGASPAW